MTAKGISRRRQLGADGLLLMVTIIWGGTFVMVKDAVTAYPVFPFLALRFALALVALLAIGWRRIATLTQKSVFSGILLGLFLFAGYAFQTFGLQHTTASKAGFITGLSVAMVPLLSALALRKRPQPAAVIGVVLATAGLALLSLSQAISVSIGDLLVLACALAFALHIVGVSAFAPHADPIALTIVQIAVVTLLSAVMSLLGPQGWPAPQASTWYAAIFTGILATALAFGIQTAAQRFTTPTHTAVIFAGEPVFAALFGVLLAGDLLTTRLILGGALILAGTLSTEIPWSERTASVISRYLAPQYAIGVLLVVLGLTDPVSWHNGLLWVLLVGLPAILVTLVIFIRALEQGTISDWHITNRHERLAPRLVLTSILFTGIPTLALYYFDGPRLMLATALAGFMLVIINLLITVVWKISQHVSSVALGATLLTAGLGPVGATTLLLIPLVAWARVKLGAHTIMQTVAGGVTGVLISVLALHLLGLG